MFGDCNLLELDGPSANLYALRVLDHLFTKEELRKGIVPGKQGLVDGGRVALNPEKIQLLRSK